MCKDTTILLYLLLALGKPLLGNRSSREENDICFTADNSTSQQLNKWSPVEKCFTDNANTPQKEYLHYWGRGFHPLATYQRGHASAPEWQQESQWRILEFMGNHYNASEADKNSAWIYVPAVNSWTRLVMKLQPAGRFGHTLTTWCKTNVILFGGRTSKRMFNDTWLFNGVEEVWEEQEVGSWERNKFISKRFGHSAVAINQPLSNCSCKESVVIYGGQQWNDSASKVTCLNDMWEMRCIVDSNGRQRFNWISISKTNGTSWPALRYGQSTADYQKKMMYLWGGRECQFDRSADFRDTFFRDVWKFNIATRIWKRAIIASQPGIYTSAHILPLHAYWVNDQSFYHRRLDGMLGINSDYVYLLKPLPPDQFIVKLTVLDVRTKITNRYGIITHSWTVVGDSIILIAFSSSEQNIKVWNATYLEYRNAYYYSDWAQVTSPLSSPQVLARTKVTASKLHQAVFVGQRVYISVTDIDQLAGDDRTFTIWQFDFISEAWFRIPYRFGPKSGVRATYSVINDSIIVHYSADPLTTPSYVRDNVHLNGSHLWLFNTTIRRWTLCLQSLDGGSVPLARYKTVMVDVGKGSLLMFGGMTNDDVLNDLWRVDVCNQKRHTAVRENCVKWVELSKNGSLPHGPCPRHSHAAFVFDGSLFIFGGTRRAYKRNQTVGLDRDRIEAAVLSDMWRFRIDEQVWKEIAQKGSIPVLSCFPYWKLTRMGRKVVVTAAGSDYWNTVVVRVKYCHNMSSIASVVFDVTTSTWSMLASNPPLLPSAIGSWMGRLVVLGWSKQSRDPYVYFRRLHDISLMQAGVLYKVYFSFLYPACSPGTTSSVWATETCTRCKKGSYAATGARHCSFCPKGLTTMSSNSTSLSNCICRNDYCNNGECIVAEPGENMRSAVCKCNTGYTGTTCQYPTYYLIGVSVLGVTVLVFLLFLFLRKAQNYKRRKRDVEKQLVLVQKVWSIDSDELSLESRIDVQTPGSYGEVYRAIYRDMTVAVKYLSKVLLSNQTIRREFEREIEVMREIRHPNIVMFFGAGKLQEGTGEETSYPFLVTEFMSRGTLKTVLDSSDVELSYTDKVRLASDAAKGMKYLHALSPPRIHRDMKSANLLVSQSWVVKVADFGAARLVRQEGERQPTGPSEPQNEGDEFEMPLLRADSLLTRNMGTVLWRAPEIFGLDDYGTSADVYR